jgi:hypothetical protein
VLVDKSYSLYWYIGTYQVKVTKEEDIYKVKYVEDGVSKQGIS